FADPTSGVANALLSPRAHGASPADTAANRRRAEFDTARARLMTVADNATAADSARCNSQVDSLAKVFGVEPAGRGGGRGGRGGGGLLGGGCGPAAAFAGRGGFGGGRGGRGNGAPVTHSDSMRVEFTAAVGQLTPLAANASK